MGSQSLVLTAMYIQSHELMLTARLILGTADAIHIIQKLTICTYLAKDKQAFALSLALTQAKFLNSLIDNIAAVVFNSYGLIFYNWLILGAQLISLSSSLLLLYYLNYDDMSASNSKADSNSAGQ